MQYVFKLDITQIHTVPGFDTIIRGLVIQPLRHSGGRTRMVRSYRCFQPLPRIDKRQHNIDC